MTPEVWMFMVGQAVGLAVLFVAGHVRMSNQLAEIRITLAHHVGQREEGLEAHLKLADQVTGISRRVERHDTLLQVESIAGKIIKAAQAGREL